VVELARGAEDAGATMINTGIGWHEARADDRDDGAARGVRPVTRRLKGACACR
jgi:2,4-dienoyl-CoA reductase (NADPH2)